MDDQAKALAFYRDVLGFEPKLDAPMGEHRWLTLNSPGDRWFDTSRLPRLMR